jgi:phosphoglycolate phosphatase
MSAPLAVFDLDGTLVDSRASIAKAMAMAFETLDLPPPGYDETRRIVGLSLEPAIRTLAPTLPQAVYPDLAEAYRQAFVANRKAGLNEALYPGAEDLVKRLAGEGWRLGIATGKARRGVDAFYERHGLAAYFECAFCADDGPGKPDPHMLRLNMETVRVRPDFTLMIGDTSFDMAMARAADAYAQGVAWGFHTPEEIEGGGAHHVADDFSILADELSAFRSRMRR